MTMGELLSQQGVAMEAPKAKLSDYQVVLPYSGKEMNPIMAKVILNRIKRGNLTKHQTSDVARTKGGI